MRTTVTLEPDIASKLRQIMRERGVSFKTALNDVLRSGLNGSTPPVRPYRINARPMGVRKGIDLTHALRLAGELEDAEIVRKLELHK